MTQVLICSNYVYGKVGTHCCSFVFVSSKVPLLVDISMFEKYENHHLNSFL